MQYSLDASISILLFTVLLVQYTWLEWRGRLRRNTKLRAQHPAAKQDKSKSNQHKASAQTPCPDCAFSSPIRFIGPSKYSTALDHRRKSSC